MPRFVELTEVRVIRDADGCTTAPLVVAADTIASLEKTPDRADPDPTVVTLRDGRRYLVEESIRTITARARPDADD
jgi:uncharacterized protein YlzI (FlbEa/FlbD family)